MSLVVGLLFPGIQSSAWLRISTECIVVNEYIHVLFVSLWVFPSADRELLGERAVALSPLDP